MYSKEPRTKHDATLLAEEKDKDETEILMNSNLNSNSVVKFNFSQFIHLENGMDALVSLNRETKQLSRVFMEYDSNSDRSNLTT